MLSCISDVNSTIILICAQRTLTKQQIGCENSIYLNAGGSSEQRQKERAITYNEKCLGVGCRGSDPPVTQHLEKKYQ